MKSIFIYRTSKATSLRMSQIRPIDTKPERIVRSLLHKAGFRFKKNVKNLPGCPDIVLAGHQLVVFVHGCFWHRHNGCNRTTTPRVNRALWNEKFRSTVARDRRNSLALRRKGWKVLIIWECQIRAPSTVLRKLSRYLR